MFESDDAEESVESLKSELASTNLKLVDLEKKLSWAKRTENELSETNKELSIQIQQNKREKNDLLKKLSDTLLANINLRDEVKSLKSKLETLNPKAVISRIEKTLERVETIETGELSPQKYCIREDSANWIDVKKEKNMNNMDESLSLIEDELIEKSTDPLQIHTSIKEEPIFEAEMNVDVDHVDVLENHHIKLEVEQDFDELNEGTVSYNSNYDRCPYSVGHMGHPNRQAISSTKQAKGKPKCPRCEFETEYPVNLRKHIEVEHEGKRFHCIKCDLKFKGQQSLRTHIQNVHEKIRYQCTQCDTKFTLYYNLLKHKRRIASKPTPDKFSCDICTNTYCFELAMRKHKKKEHTEETERLPCDECSKVFYNKQNLNRHKKTSHTLKT